MYRTEFRLTCPSAYGTGIDLSLTTETRPPELRDLRALSTFILRSGACYLQTYLTADELRQIGKACFAAAVDLDSATAPAPIPAGEVTEVSNELPA